MITTVSTLMLVFCVVVVVFALIRFSRTFGDLSGEKSNRSRRGLVRARSRRSRSRNRRRSGGRGSGIA